MIVQGLARFNLIDLQVGLVFLPNGAGCVAGSHLTGYLMDHDYKTVKRRCRQAKGIPAGTTLNKKELVDFPIEKSRLRNISWIIVIFVFTVALYGFSLPLNIIAIPLVLQFFIAYTATAVFSFNSALVIVLYLGASASATAVNNLMRCSIGAAGVAVVQLIIDAIGAGPTFALFASTMPVLSPLMVVVWFYGEGWRRERKERLKVKENQKNAMDVEDT
jgi:hypothetical protein